MPNLLAQRVSQQLLNTQAKINRDTYYGVCCYNGKVKIYDTEENEP